MPHLKIGILAGLGAFLTWGLFPLYWKPLSSISAMSINAARLAESFIVLFIYLVIKHKNLNFIRSSLKKENLSRLLLSTVLIAANWILFVYAVNSGQTLQTSLGYFMGPILSILLGMIVLGEKQSRLKK